MVYLFTKPRANIIQCVFTCTVGVCWRYQLPGRHGNTSLACLVMWPMAASLSLTDCVVESGDHVESGVPCFSVCVLCVCM